MAVIYLHIGFEKTGSTYLQEILKRNSEFLSKKKIVVPSMFFKRSNMSELVSCFIPSDARNNMQCPANTKSFLNEFSEFLSVNREASIIISSEHFSSRLTELDEIQSLRNYLESFGHVIKVICFYRDPKSWAQSRYSQYVKSGGILRPADFFTAKGQMTESIRRSLVYLNVLKIWEQVFERNFICLDYDLLVKKAELLKAFFNVLGINNISKISLVSDLKGNPRLSNGQIKALRILNILSKSFIVRRFFIKLFSYKNHVFFSGNNEKIVKLGDIDKFIKSNKLALNLYLGK